MNKHTGSNFNDWLNNEGINQEVTAIAVKRVKAELERLANMPDSEIDYSDMPQLTDEQIANFKKGKDVFAFLNTIDIASHEFTGEELGELLLESVRQAKAGQGITRPPINHA